MMENMGSILSNPGYIFCTYLHVRYSYRLLTYTIATEDISRLQSHPKSVKIGYTNSTVAFFFSLTEKRRKDSPE